MSLALNQKGSDRIHTSLVVSYHSPLLGVDIDTTRVCDPDLF
jgi:hypothetical protein